MQRVLDVLAGFHLASVLLLLLGVLTWLGTLAQVDMSLYDVKREYFSWETFFVRPMYNGYHLPIVLPNAFWVGVVFFLNLSLGTIFKARWRWKTLGVLISHGGILFLLAGAFVTQVWSKRGNMAIYEGQTSNVAQHYTDHVLEVSEMDGDTPSKVHVIDTEFLTDLEPDDTRLFRMKNLPFDLRVQEYRRNAWPTSIRSEAPSGGATVIDGFFLKPDEDAEQAEANFAGCRIAVLDKKGTELSSFLVSVASYYPATVQVEGKNYTVQIAKSSWKMPFKVHLTKFTHKYHPGTLRPKVFESEIERIEGEHEEEVLIQMNEPMRHGGLTFFQASWGPQEGKPDRKLFSKFEVVKNPADQWPWYAILVVTAGLLFQFGMSLTLFILKQSKSDA